MRSRFMTVLGVLLALMLVVSACTSSSKPKGVVGSSTGSSTSGPAKSSSTSAKPVAVKPPYQGKLPASKLITNVVAKRKQVSMSTCGAVAGGWSAKGSAHNPGKKPVAYAITVFFTTNQATVQSYAAAKLTVPAGKTVPWTAAARFPASKPTLCVLRGVG